MQFRDFAFRPLTSARPRWPVLLTAALLLASTDAMAWGTKGHRIVCQIAWRETTDAGRALARQLLGVSDAKNFAGTCNWPDDVRDTAGYSWSKPHHFIEPPRGATFDVDQHCPDGGCAPRAIGQQARIVVDANEPAQRRAEALEFVAHFVGDLHQPLHAGYSKDLGGNSVQVKFCPDGCVDSVDNLHKVWDSGILALSGSEAKLIGELESALTDAERSDWKDDSVRTWAEETHTLAESHAYHRVKNGAIESANLGDLPEPVEIGQGYLPVMKPIVKQQLQRAGVRLAATLDALGQGKVPPTLTAVAPRFVEPSGDALSVRAKASPNAATLAQLAPGERAELLGIEPPGKSQPKFFRVRLKDGTQGYVPKKNARVVSQ